MENFDINKVLATYKPVNEGEVARLLFPSAKYPTKAFARVKSGESKLDIDQVTLLADYFGVNVQELISPKNRYRVVITKGLYRAVIPNSEPDLITITYVNQQILSTKIDTKAKTINDIYMMLDKIIEENEKKVNRIINQQ